MMGGAISAPSPAAAPEGWLLTRTFTAIERIVPSFNRQGRLLGDRPSEAIVA